MKIIPTQSSHRVLAYDRYGHTFTLYAGNDEGAAEAAWEQAISDGTTDHYAGVDLITVRAHAEQE